MLLREYRAGNMHTIAKWHASAEHDDDELAAHAGARAAKAGESASINEKHASHHAVAGRQAHGRHARVCVSPTARARYARRFRAGAWPASMVISAAVTYHHKGHTAGIISLLH